VAAADGVLEGEDSPAAAAASAAAAREEAGEPTMKPKQFISHLDEANLVAAIAEAESKTSGEIRVFLSHRKPDDAVAAAQRAFHQLGMTRTRQRNGVLIFVAPKARKFAVIGDSGVHQRCGDEFWKALADEMSGHFRKAEFTSGITHGIRKAGELLARHFPRRADDVNELPDDIAHD
jgi:uncharacterized membrane protein